MIITAVLACALGTTNANAENIFADPGLWMFEKAVPDNPDDAGYSITPEDGLHMITGGGGSGRVYRDITVEAGQRLTLDVAYDAQGGLCKGLMANDCASGGTVDVPGLMLSFFTPYDVDGGGNTITLPVSDEFTHEWTFTEPGTHRFQFEVYGDEVGGGPSHITLDVTGTITAIPEPTTWLLLMNGLALTCITRRTPGGWPALGANG
jgi:hypothetical protein